MMQEESISIKYKRAAISDLNESDQELVALATKCADSAYAPYSNFFVGTALKLDDGTIVKGNNQENAAYPSGLCAERVALFSASANYPNVGIDTIAVYARPTKGETPVSPCGSCRQVMSEYENKQDRPIRVLLVNDLNVLEFTSSLDLLPLHFTP